MFSKLQKYPHKKKERNLKEKLKWKWKLLFILLSECNSNNDVPQEFIISTFRCTHVILEQFIIWQWVYQSTKKQTNKQTKKLPPHNSALICQVLSPINRSMRKKWSRALQKRKYKIFDRKNAYCLLILEFSYLWQAKLKSWTILAFQDYNLLIFPIIKAQDSPFSSPCWCFMC